MKTEVNFIINFISSNKKLKFYGSPIGSETIVYVATAEQVGIMQGGKQSHRKKLHNFGLTDKPRNRNRATRRGTRSPQSRRLYDLFRDACGI